MPALGNSNGDLGLMGDLSNVGSTPISLEKLFNKAGECKVGVQFGALENAMRNDAFGGPYTKEELEQRDRDTQTNNNNYVECLKDGLAPGALAQPPNPNVPKMLDGMRPTLNAPVF